MRSALSSFKLQEIKTPRSPFSKKVRETILSKKQMLQPTTSLNQKEHGMEVIPFQVPNPSFLEHVAMAAEPETDQKQSEWSCRWQNCSKNCHSQQELIIHLEKHLELKTFKCGWFECWNDIQYSSKTKLNGIFFKLI